MPHEGSTSTLGLSHILNTLSEFVTRIQKFSNYLHYVRYTERGVVCPSRSLLSTEKFGIVV